MERLMRIRKLMTNSIEKKDPDIKGLTIVN